MVPARRLGATRGRSGNGCHDGRADGSRFLLAVRPTQLRRQARALEPSRRPFKEGLNQTRKYIASSSLDADLPWPNSTLLSGHVPAEVAALREQPGGNLAIMGNGQLIRSLLPHGLIDELFLMTHPLVLGAGHRLFGPDDDVHRLRLVDSTPTADPYCLATYQPVQRVS